MLTVRASPSDILHKLFYLANLKLAEHCTGDCSNDEIDAARDQCTTEYEANNPGAQCDCHCHGAEGMKCIPPNQSVLLTNGFPRALFGILHRATDQRCKGRVCSCSGWNQRHKRRRHECVCDRFGGNGIGIGISIGNRSCLQSCCGVSTDVWTCPAMLCFPDMMGVPMPWSTSDITMS